MLRNLTLEAMDPADFASLRPELTEREVFRGEVLIDQRSYVKTVAFLASAEVVNVVTFLDGHCSETFDMGVEGVTGLAAFLAEGRCAWGVQVREPGVVYEVSARSLRRLTETSPTLRRQLLDLTNEYQAQAAINVACTAHHTVDGRLAALILLRTDRAPGEKLRYTQEDLATRLGVARTTVTLSALKLKRAGAISYVRGGIRILDRKVLGALACECHHMRLQLAN